jgi:hypothetical protein
MEVAAGLPLTHEAERHRLNQLVRAPPPLTSHVRRDTRVLREVLRAPTPHA